MRFAISILHMLSSSHSAQNPTWAYNGWSEPVNLSNIDNMAKGPVFIKVSIVYLFSPENNN